MNVSSEGRVGIYSGTFDPIHPGHVAFAVAAMRACGLDKVVFLPDPKPRNKQNVTSLSHRLALIALTIESTPGLESLKLTSERFTVKGTLPKLQSLFPDAHLTLLMGSDVARSLEHWPNVRMLLYGASLAIGLRQDDDPDAIVASLDRLGRERGVPADYTLVTAEGGSLASSKVRSSADGLSQLPPAALAYINEHSLYESAPGSAPEE